MHDLVVMAIRNVKLSKLKLRNKQLFILKVTVPIFRGSYHSSNEEGVKMRFLSRAPQLLQ